jgi:hypothetical protein
VEVNIGQEHVVGVNIEHEYVVEENIGQEHVVGVNIG